jgi:hypothetical protein
MTTYTVFCTQDSSSHESGLSLNDATREFWSRNGGRVRDYGDALYLIVTDSDFGKIAAEDDFSYSPVKPAGWQA